jgi:hypothetical protein
LCGRRRGPGPSHGLHAARPGKTGAGPILTAEPLVARRPRIRSALGRRLRLPHLLSPVPRQQQRGVIQLLQDDAGKMAVTGGMQGGQGRDVQAAHAPSSQVQTATNSPPGEARAGQNQVCAWPHLGVCVEISAAMPPVCPGGVMPPVWCMNGCMHARGRQGPNQPLAPPHLHEAVQALLGDGGSGAEAVVVPGQGVQRRVCVPVGRQSAQRRQRGVGLHSPARVGLLWQDCGWHAQPTHTCERTDTHARLHAQQRATQGDLRCR